MTLKIYLLGQFKLANGERPLALTSRPAQSLLAYLAMTAGMTHRRERLAGLLWPESDETNARAYLRQALWRIRKTLDDGALSPEDYLQISDLSVTFNAQSDYWLDVNRVLDSGEPASLEWAAPSASGLFADEPKARTSFAARLRELIGGRAELAARLLPSILGADAGRDVAAWNRLLVERSSSLPPQVIPRGWIALAR